MNKQKRRRAKRRKEARRGLAENEASKNQEELALHESAQPGPSRSIGKTADAKPMPSGRPHPLTITLSIIGILLTCIIFYWSVIQPDIRYVQSLAPETLTVVESKVDSAGNFVHSLRLRPTFTNYSIKPGFIDKAEFVPQSIATLPDIKITSINKTAIFWHQKKQIEITFLMTVPTDVANNPNTTRELAVEQVLAVYDNTGRRVDHLESGLFGRIRFNFKDIVKNQLIPKP